MQQVKAEKTVQMSAMQTSKGADDTKSDPTIITMKNSVLHALLTLSKFPLPAPLPAPMVTKFQLSTVIYPTKLLSSFKTVRLPRENHTILQGSPLLFLKEVAPTPQHLEIFKYSNRNPRTIASKLASHGDAGNHLKARKPCPNSKER